MRQQHNEFSRGSPPAVSRIQKFKSDGSPFTKTDNNNIGIELTESTQRNRKLSHAEVAEMHGSKSRDTRALSASVFLHTPTISSPKPNEIADGNKGQRDSLALQSWVQDVKVGDPRELQVRVQQTQKVRLNSTATTTTTCSC
jgi:hypothetical protein